MLKKSIMIFIFLLAGCRTTMNYDPATKMEGVANRYTMPSPAPFTPEDYILIDEPFALPPEGIEQRDLRLCGADYIQFVVTLRLTEPIADQFTNTLHVEYARQRQEFEIRSGVALNLQRDTDTYTYTADIARFNAWPALVEGFRITPQTPVPVEIQEVRLIHNGEPSLCEPELPLVYSDLDFVFDYNSRFARFVHLVEYDIIDDQTITFIPGNDPFIYSRDLELCAEDYNQVVIRLRVPEGHPNRVMQFFYERGWGDFQQEDSYTIRLEDNGDFNDYIIPVGLLENWNGIIRAVRVDPVAGGIQEGDNRLELADFRLMRNDDPSHCPEIEPTNNRD